MFFREINNSSLNYNTQNSRIIKKIHDNINFDNMVLLSLEDKSRRRLFSKFEILEEPIEDIHSLMYYSKLFMSDGDSMAREAAMLGTKSVYCGLRNMVANNILKEKKLLNHINDFNILSDFISNMLQSNSKEQKEEQSKIRKRLLLEWDDLNELIYKEIVGSK